MQKLQYSQKWNNCCFSFRCVGWRQEVVVFNQSCEDKQNVANEHWGNQIFGHLDQPHSLKRGLIYLYYTGKKDIFGEMPCNIKCVVLNTFSVVNRFRQGCGEDAIHHLILMKIHILQIFDDAVLSSFHLGVSCDHIAECVCVHCAACFHYHMFGRGCRGCLGYSRKDYFVSNELSCVAWLET